MAGKHWRLSARRRSFPLKERMWRSRSSANCSRPASRITCAFIHACSSERSLVGAC